MGEKATKNKIVGLNSIAIVKNYIDGIRRELTDRVDAATGDYLNERLDEAQKAIMDAYKEDSKDLRERISYVESFGEEFPGQLQQLQLQLSALEGNTQDKFEALDALKVQTDILTGKYDDLYDGITTGSVFNAGQLDEIIKTAMIKEVQITDDAILTPEMYATKVVGLIANFGKVKAANIEAGDIKGSSIESLNITTSTGEPVWRIDNAGDGWLAQKNIQWDANGNVTFGPDVKISWRSIEDGTSTLNGAISKYDETIKNYIDDYVMEHTDGAATQKELAAARKDAENALADAKASLGGSIDDARRDLGDALTETSEYLEKDYIARVDATNAALKGAQKALEEAIKAGDEETANKYKELIEELKLQQRILIDEFGKQQNALLSLEDRITATESALDPKQMSDLIAASLIEKTEIGEDEIITPSLLAKEITALIGTFGDVYANTMTANTIEGFTVQSPTAVRDEDGFLVYEYDKYVNEETGDIMEIPKRIKRKKPTWQLNTDGSGFVGRGAVNSPTYEQDGITWDDEGNISLGENVTIKWNKVDGGSDALNDVKAELNKNIGDAEDRLEKSINTNSTTVVNNILNGWSADGKLSPIEQKELKRMYDDLYAEHNTIIADYNSLSSAGVSVPDKSSFNAAFDALTKTVIAHIGGITTNTVVDIIESGDTAYNNISNYYSERQTFLNKLNDAVASYKAKITLNAANDNIEAAKKSLSDDLKKAKDELNLAFASGDAAAIAAANGAVSKAENAQKALTALQGAILNSADNVNSGIKTSVLNSGDIWNISKAALIDETTITGDTVESENVLAKNIIGLAGTFAKVKAENIEGTTISGLNIQSAETGIIDGVEKPLWKIDNNGDGWLGAGHITFDANGIQINGDDILTGINSASEEAKDNFGTMIADHIDVGSIDADKITVTKLNTTGEGNIGTGTIQVIDNDIKVFDKNNPKEIMRITGGELSNIPGRVAINSASVLDTTKMSWTQIKTDYWDDNVNSAIIIKKVPDMTINVNNNDDYLSYIEFYSNNSQALYLNLTREPNGYNIELPFDYLPIYLFVKQGENPVIPSSINDNYINTTIFSNNTETNPDEIITNNITRALLQINGTHTVFTQNTTTENLFNAIAQPGNYDVYVVLSLNFVEDHKLEPDDVYVTDITFTVSDLYVSPGVNRCDVSPNGFRYVVDVDNYVKFDNAGNIEMHKKVDGSSYGIKLDNNGLQLRIGSNTWGKLGTKTINGNTVLTLT